MGKARTVARKAEIATATRQARIDRVNEEIVRSSLPAYLKQILLGMTELLD